MVDLIDYALDHYTDFIKFEQIANEIMSQEGFLNLKPIGGIHDDGMDAISKFYTDEDEPDTIVFQYTLQKDISSKINNTYKKLKDNAIKFSQLYIVTPTRVNNKIALQKKFREKHGKSVVLEIYERELFRTRLAEDASLRSRYFPDIKKQIIELNETQGTNDTENKDYEINLYKVSLLFAQDKDFYTRSHKKIFDEIVLLGIYNLKTCVFNELSKEIEKILNLQKVDRGRLNASVNRLIKNEHIETNENDILSLTSNMMAKIEVAKSHVDSDKSGLFDSIINDVVDHIGRDLEPGIKYRIKQNCEESLTDLFKYYVFELNFDSIENLSENGSSFVEKLTKSLSNEIADGLTYCLGKILESPSLKEKQTLEVWRNSYLGAQLLKLDPKQNNLEAKQFKGLTIVLDTDFVLNLIISELQENSLYQQIIKRLNSYGAKIVIPEQILEEVQKHAEYAHRNYKFFDARKEQLEYEQIMEQVRNLFAKGFFKATHIDGYNLSFNDYIKNYTFEDNTKFLKDFIYEEVNQNIDFLNLKDINLSDEEFAHFEEMVDEVLNMTKGSHKASYRDDEENREIAETDARLFMDIQHKNNETKKNTAHKFQKDYYIVTSSTKVIKAARKLQIYEPIYFSPIHLVSLIEKIEPFETRYDEIHNIFLNPYLTYAISENSEIVTRLLELGVDLKGHKLTRLQYELGNTYEKILKGRDESPEQETDTETQDDTDDLLEIYEDLKERNFKFIDSIETIMNKVDETNKKIEETNKKTERTKHRHIDIIEKIQKKK